MLRIIKTIICSLAIVFLVLQAQAIYAQEEIFDGILLISLAKSLLLNESRKQYVELINVKGEKAPLPSHLAEVKNRFEKLLNRKLTLSVVHDNDFNAAAFPSGDMFITSRAVEELKDDDGALAAILGHEITHFQREHSLNNFRRRIALDFTLRQIVKKQRLQ